MFGECAGGLLSRCAACGGRAAVLGLEYHPVLPDGVSSRLGHWLLKSLRDLGCQLPRGWCGRGPGRSAVVRLCFGARWGRALLLAVNCRF